MNFLTAFLLFFIYSYPLSFASSFHVFTDQIPNETCLDDCESKDRPINDLKNSQSIDYKYKESNDLLLLPLALLDINGFTRAVNQTTQKKDGELTLDDYQDGFYITKYRHWTVGVGVNLSSYFEIASDLLGQVSFNLGIAAIKGKKIIKKYFVNSKEEIKEKIISIPYKPSDLKNWNIGDVVNYQSFGGVLVKASINLPYAHVGSYITMLGNFETTVEKIDQSKVIVSVSRGNIKHAAVFTGTIMASLSAQSIRKVKKGLSFEINLNDSQSIIAYEHLLRGNMTMAQDMANDILNENITRVNTFKSLLLGKKKKLYIGLPFYNRTKEKSKLYSFSRVENHKNNLITVSEYGIRIKESKSRKFKTYKKSSKAFYGGVAKTFDKNQKIISNTFHAKFFWRWEKDRSSSNTLNHAMGKITKDTGILELSQHLAPTQINEKLKYSQIDFQYRVNSQLLRYLMENDGENPTFVNYKNTIFNQINHYFSTNQNDKLHLCGKSSMYTCRKKIIRKVEKIIEKIKHALALMNDSITKDSKKFVKEFSIFGNLIFANTFTFHSFYTVSKNCGASFRYEVSGRRISKFLSRKIYPFNKDKCLIH